jgi:hypothetical protein
MTEIDNGSIFCSCLKAQFVDALIRFSQSPVGLLLVESSGSRTDGYGKNTYGHSK